MEQKCCFDTSLTTALSISYLPSFTVKETGFLSNKNDRILLTSDDGVDKITDNIKYSLVDFKQSIENIQVKVSND